MCFESVDWVLIRIAALAGVGGFLFGYDLGLIGGALLAMKSDPRLSQMSMVTQEVVVGAFKLGAFFGTFFGGALMLRYGRRRAIAATCIATVCGPLIMSLSLGPSGLIIGRLVGGFGIGASATVTPAYLAEVAPPNHRGAMVLTYEVMLCGGMLAAGLVDVILQGTVGGWRWMVGLPALPASLLALSLVLLPESPRWLLMRGNASSAREVLRLLLKGTKRRAASDSEFQAKVESEMSQLCEEVECVKKAQMERLNAMGSASSYSQTHSQNGHDTQLGVISQQPKTGFSHVPTPVHTAASAGQDENESGGGEGQGLVSVSLGTCNESKGGEGQALGGAASLQPWDEQRGEKGPLLEGCGNGSSNINGTASHNVSSCTAGPPTAYPSPPLSSVHVGGETGRWLEGCGTGSSCCDGIVVIAKEEAREGWQEQYLTQHDLLAGGGMKSDGAERHCVLPGFESSFGQTLAVMLKDTYLVATGPESRAFAIAMWLAFFNQATASTAVINFAPTLLAEVDDMSPALATLASSSITAAKTIGVLAGLVLVDRIGRRPLLAWGAVGCSAALLFAAMTLYIHSASWLTLAALSAFMLSFSASWAGGFWVLTSEVFSLGAKSPGVSAATAMLFLTGSLTNFVFMSLLSAAGWFSFVIFAFISMMAAVYVHFKVPETRGKSLGEVQRVMQDDRGEVKYELLRTQ